MQKLPVRDRMPLRKRSKRDFMVTIDGVISSREKTLPKKMEPTMEMYNIRDTRTIFTSVHIALSR